jgi:hypothetical protein
MDAEPIPKIVEAERMRRGLLILFENGKQAFYSTELSIRFFPWRRF